MGPRDPGPRGFGGHPPEPRGPPYCRLRPRPCAHLRRPTDRTCGQASRHLRLPADPGPWHPPTGACGPHRLRPADPTGLSLRKSTSPSPAASAHRSKLAVRLPEPAAAHRSGRRSGGSPLAAACRLRRAHPGCHLWRPLAAATEPARRRAVDPRAVANHHPEPLARRSDAPASRWASGRPLDQPDPGTPGPVRTRRPGREGVRPAARSRRPRRSRPRPRPQPRREPPQPRERLRRPGPQRPEPRRRPPQRRAPRPRRPARHHPAR